MMVDWKQLVTTREQILFLGVLISIFVLFFRLIYFPKRIDQVQLQSQVQSLRAEKEALQKFTEALRLSLTMKKASGAKEATPPLQILKGELDPLATDTPTLFDYFATPEFSKGLLIKEMNDLPIKKETHYKKTNFYMNIEGSFKNTLDYLKRVEKFPAILSVDDIGLKNTDVKASQVALEMHGTLYQLEETVEETK